MVLVYVVEYCIGEVFVVFEIVWWVIVVLVVVLDVVFVLMVGGWYLDYVGEVF